MKYPKVKIQNISKTFVHLVGPEYKSTHTISIERHTQYHRQSPVFLFSQSICGVAVDEDQKCNYHVGTYQRSIMAI